MKLRMPDRVTLKKDFAAPEGGIDPVKMSHRPCANRYRPPPVIVRERGRPHGSAHHAPFPHGHIAKLGELHFFERLEIEPPGGGARGKEHGFAVVGRVDGPLGQISPIGQLDQAAPCLVLGEQLRATRAVRHQNEPLHVAVEAWYEKERVMMDRRM